MSNILSKIILSDICKVSCDDFLYQFIKLNYKIVLHSKLKRNQISIVKKKKNQKLLNNYYIKINILQNIR